ncbi:hypothetical protein BU15DRAFT_74842 [Melanogaster broomeanus]|nr:hypothetical protein BU15DRAFT_74842 [Melanogaster broomeanus]
MIESFIAQGDEAARWTALISESNLAVKQFLAAEIDFSTFIRCVTFRVFLVVFLRLGPDLLTSEEVQRVTEALNEFYEGSTNVLPSEIQSILEQWLPPNGFPDPLDRILPAYEALWRIVASTVIFCEDDESRRGVILDFRDNPRDRQYKASYKSDELSVSEMIDEVVRHPSPIARMPSTAPKRPFGCILHTLSHMTAEHLPAPQEALKAAALVASKVDPGATADALLAVEMQKLRIAEALAARDNVVDRLEDAYTSVRQKAATILRLEQELEHLKRSSTPANANSTGSQTVFQHPPTPPVHEQDQDQSVKEVHENQTQSTWESRKIPIAAPSELPPCTPDKLADALQSNSAYCPYISTNSPVQLRETYSPAFDTVTSDEENQASFPVSQLEGEPEKTIAARQAILAALPLPSGIPDDALQPIILPAPYTLHDFLGNASGDRLAFSNRPPVIDNMSDMSRLSNHRVLAQLTTYWCTEREEHGYFLTPFFKCSTNPHVATAHLWSAVDVLECFYNKDGKWYYAGTYKAFRMDDLTVQEWEALSTESFSTELLSQTTQVIVKATLAGRKNVSPQNHYETAQLYAAGALRVACVGLQCVGFSEDVYRGVLEQSRIGYWGRDSAWMPTRTPTI